MDAPTQNADAAMPNDGRSASTGFKTNLRWWILGAILVLGPVTEVVIGQLPMLSSLHQELYATWARLTWMALVLLWVLVFSGMSWVIRVTVLACVIGGVWMVARFMPQSPRPVLGPQMNQFVQPSDDAELPVLPTTRSSAPIDLTTTLPTDYPRFLGADGRADISGVNVDPDWTAHPPKEIWRHPVGLGKCAFAVVGKYALTQEQRGDNELVTCYNVATGELEWAHADPVRFSESQGGDGPRATPTIDHGRVYAMGATGILNCLDGGNGAVIWSHDILDQSHQGNLQWGKSCSPLIVDNKVVVSLGSAGSPGLAAYDKDTGQVLWRSGPGPASYASPVLAVVAGKRQIISVSDGNVTGYDPDDGHQLWNYGWVSGIKCSQPVALPGDRVFISAGYGVGCVMLKINAGPGDSMSVSELWRFPRMKTQFANIVVYDGYAFGLDEEIMSCMDLSNGRLKWKNGRYGKGQIMLVGDKILILGDGGDLSIIRADPTKGKELAEVSVLQGRTWNNLAMTGPYLLVRNDEEAACYELATLPPSTQPSSRPSQ